LVDEFQDTDPVQYEIILYLAERAGRHDVVWDQIDLEPGKLFIVGDPKQSIYSFRRADIEAFERVTEKILAQGGAAYSLTTNFRSDRVVLDVVNDLFDRLFTPSPHVQPSHERLTVRPDRQPEVSPAGVQIRLVVPKEDDEPFDAATATRTEAEALARWITDTLAHATMVDPQKRRVPLQPGQIALIFRKLTHAQDYLDALRRYGIQYMTDGEKHFYRRQEIIDLINVLRVIDNPQDRIALVGLLRSPLGGIPDQTLFELSQLHCLDYTKPECLTASGHPSAATLEQLYHTLNDLRRSAPLRPVPDAIELLFDRLPILELAAASLHGEQAVANLVKVRILAEELADRPHLTLTGFLDVMRERLIDEPEEAESALAEESPDAVRVLTIHKAKGLEFPVVILPGLHQGSRLPDKGPTLHHDWSTRLYGIKMKDRSNLGALVVDAKIQAREQAEQQRLLYVGMTRARDLLVLSGGQTATNGRDSVLSLLEDAIPELTGSTSEGPISLGTGRLTQVVIPTSATTRQHRPERDVVNVPFPSLDVLTKRREARVDRWSTERLSERRLTPSLLMSKRPPVRVAASLRPPDKVESRLLGVCAHSLLEEWNFSSLDGDLVSAIERACVRHLPAERLDEGQALRQELHAMFSSFLVSKPYARLQRATMLGREVPFVIPWDGQYVMEGIIDVIYRLDGRLWIADYKTDIVTAGEASTRAETYRRQADIYRAAVKQSLGMDASFQFVFLRPAVTIDM
jgi:ATP-dependent helicase/nuclease subunit A